MISIPDLLLACLQYSPPDDGGNIAQLSDADWEELLALASRHGVAPLLFFRLQASERRASVPVDVTHALRLHYLQNSLRNDQFLQGLQKTVGLLNLRRIPVMVLKGACLATSVYEHVGLRTMVDLDLLVRREHVQRVAEILLRLGYHPLTPIYDYAAQLSDEFHHLPRFIKPGAPPIEVHWTITRSNQRYAIDPDLLWQRAQPISIAGIDVLGLCPEDLLLHICLHATYQHQFLQGARFLCDIAEIVHRYQGESLGESLGKSLEELQWPVVVQRANEWGWQRGVFLALLMAQRLLGAAVPEDVLRSLDSDGLELANAGDLQALLFPEQHALLNETSASFLALWKTDDPGERARIFFASLFQSRNAMASMYPVSANSPRLYWYYLVRFKDLIGRYAVKSWRMWRGEPEMAALLIHQERLDRWLNQV